MAKKKMSKPAKGWLDAALAAKDPATIAALLARVAPITPLTEREARLLRPRFTKRKDDGGVEIDQDAMIDALIAACVVDEDNFPLVPDGREGELPDIPTTIYQKLAQDVLAANGYTSAEGNS